MHKREFRLFAESELREYLAQQLESVKKKIHSESDNYLLNANETEYTAYVVNQFSIEPLVLDFEKVFINTYEKDIPVEQFPHEISFLTRFDKSSYLRNVIVYHIPRSGSAKLLRMKPVSRWLMRSEKVYEANDCLCFEITVFRSNPDPTEIKREADDILSFIKDHYQDVMNDVNAFNAGLEKNVSEFFHQRKKSLMGKNNLLAALGVPLKQRADLPTTFAIPNPAIRQKIVVRPEVTEKGYTPDPTLNQAMYNSILQIIHDAGKMLERQPSTYQGKHEEDLRDLLLFQLQPHFEGAATGETFNKQGKTDILLRHENKNAFIAECKFWHGEKKYLETISQLLGYLTWRDSKAAVILFVQNKELSDVLTTVEQATPKHSNYLGFVNKREETWFNYRLHINGDKNREVKLAVLLFHLP